MNKKKLIILVIGVLLVVNACAKESLDYGESQGDKEDNIQIVESDCCSEEQNKAGFKCVQDCGPPVARPGQEHDIVFSCLSPEQAERREKYGCPICLSFDTVISTPEGGIPVQNLNPRMWVWTVDNGRKTAQQILKVSSSAVPHNHKVMHLLLRDGRELVVSPAHPTIDGKPVADLRIGEVYDGSIVDGLILEPYHGDKTFDILPSGDTGFYWANGILMSSTLR